MNYAQVINGTVENVIVWDGETELALEGDLMKLDGIAAGPGWTFDGTSFTPPPTPPSELDDA